MKILKISICLFVFFMGFHGLCNANNFPDTFASNSENDSVLNNVYALAKRVLKDKAVDFIFERIDKDASGDVFEISGRKDKILIKGNTGVSIASGLN